MTTARYPIRAGDYEGGGAAARRLKEQLKQVGAEPAVVRRAMIAAYEAEMNVVIHAQGGELVATLDGGQLDVEVTDSGPGIADVAQALRPGFSTAPAAARELGFGAGMGLPNIQKNVDRFALESGPGRGTTVRFTIFLKAPALYGTGPHALRILPARCRQSGRCLPACPTRAIRVRQGRPQILDYLCIDCTSCLAACPSGTLVIDGLDPAAPLPPADGRALLTPAAALAQFGPLPPQRVLDELARLGFSQILLLDAWEEALRAAVLAHAAEHPESRPLISPACPAVVNLIALRFPALLPNVAPFLGATAAARTALADRALAVVVLCPAQRTALQLEGPAPDTDAHGFALVHPHALRAALLPALHTRPGSLSASETSRGRPGGTDDDRGRLYHISGIRHVMRVLEAIEDGLATDVEVLEPWACPHGCFGSPLLADDPHLARPRAPVLPAPDPPARAVPRTTPRTPRPGLRLDRDMSRAIAKLARIDKLTRTLPGSDCGLCGAPTCAALAEDIVLGRATAEACVRQHPAASRQARSTEPGRTDPTAETAP